MWHLGYMTERLEDGFEMGVKAANDRLLVLEGVEVKIRWGKDSVTVLVNGHRVLAAKGSRV